MSSVQNINALLVYEWQQAKGKSIMISFKLCDQ